MSSAYIARAVISVIIRLVCVAYVVLAGWAIPNAWSLTENEYELKGSTLYVPIQICNPQSITFGVNQTVQFVDAVTANATASTANASDATTPACHTMDHLINACVLSIILSMAAMVLFFVFDALSYFKKVRIGAVMGISLMLVFILVMAAACCYALYEEMDSWETYFQKEFDDMDDSQNEYGIQNVQTHGNKAILAIAFVLALIAAGSLLLDTFILFCCGENVKPRTTNGKPDAPLRASEQPKPEPSPVEPETPPAGGDDEPLAGSGKPAWTNG